MEKTQEEETEEEEKGRNHKKERAHKENAVEKQRHQPWSDIAARRLTGHLCFLQTACI